MSCHFFSLIMKILWNLYHRKKNPDSNLCLIESHIMQEVNWKKSVIIQTYKRKLLSQRIKFFFSSHNKIFEQNPWAHNEDTVHVGTYRRQQDQRWEPVRTAASAVITLYPTVTPWHCLSSPRLHLHSARTHFWHNSFLVLVPWWQLSAFLIS